MSEMAIGSFIFAVIFFLISVVIMRWAFRINDIVNRLDKIISLQTKPEIKGDTPAMQAFIDRHSNEVRQ